MKKLIVCTLIVLVANYSTAPAKRKERFRCPMVRINDQLIVDQYEVTIDEWMAFMHYNLSNYRTKQQTFNRLSPCIDSASQTVAQQFSLLKKWYYDEHQSESLFESTITRSEYYFPIDPKSPKKDFEKLMLEHQKPVTGITYEQALLYLSWRENYFMEFESGIDTPGMGYKAVLPRFGVWTEIAKQAGPRAAENHSENPDSINALGCYLIRCRETKPCSNTLEGEALYGKQAFPVVAGYYPDQFGLMSFYGNVAEMLHGRDSAAGGSFAHYAKASMPGKIQHYNKAAPWLGLRCYFVKDKWN